MNRGAVAIVSVGLGFCLGSEWERRKLPVSKAEWERRLADTVILHVSGPAVTRPNRGGGADRFGDALLYFHDAEFKRAATFSLRDLESTLPNRRIEYKNPARWPEPHTFAGPLLQDVLAACGATGGTEIVVTGLDGYASALPMRDVREHSMMLAHSMDDRHIPLGGRGPLYLMFQDARQRDMGISRTVWGVFHIHVS